VSQRNAEGIHLFDTAIGRCGLGWTRRGLDQVALPCADPRGVEEKLQRHAPDRTLAARPPAAVRQAVRRIRAHLSGRLDHLRDVAVDFSTCSPFARRVYRALKKVDPGEVITYSGLARKAGSAGAARAVGRAMATNPVPLVVPCHRVLTSDRKLGGFSAEGGTALKARLPRRPVYDHT